MKNIFLSFCLVSLLFALPRLDAANSTWVNTGSTSANWSETTNWSGGTVPGGTSSSDSSVVTFNAPLGTYGTSGNPILIDSTNLNGRQLTFTGSSGGYVIGTTGGNALHLNTAWGTLIDLQSGFSGSNTTVSINAPLVLNVTPNTYGVVANYSPLASNSLVINGAISGGLSSTWLRLTAAGAGTVNTINGAISDGAGPLRIEKVGSTSTWELFGLNSYSGSTTISGGALRINSASSLGDGSVTNTLVLGGGNLEATGGSYDLGVNRTMEITSNSNILQISSGTLTLSGAISSSATATLTLGGTGEIVASGAISGSSLSLQKRNTGTAVLSGGNSYGGVTTLVDGVLKISAANNLGSGGVGNSIASSGGVLVTDGTFDLGVNRSIAMGGYTRVRSDSGTLTLSGNVAGTGIFELQGDGNIIVSGSIGNSNQFIKSGNGTVSLGSANTYTGQTTVSGGLLRLNHATALPGGIGASGGTSNLSLSGGVLGLGSGDFSRAIGLGVSQFQIGASGGGFAAYSADRTVNIGGAGASVTWSSSGFLVSGATLTLGASDADAKLIWVNPLVLGSGGVNTRTIQVMNDSAAVDAEMTGNISQTGGTQSLTKTGAGTLALSGSNTYIGATTVSAGTLLLNGSLAAASAVTVSSGGTLGGSGVINGSVTVQSGGALAPGNSPGLLTVGSLTLNAGSTTSFEINGTGRGTTFDAIDITSGGGLEFGGTFTLAFGSSLVNGTNLDLFNFSTTSTGDFSSVTSTGSYAGSWSKSGDIWSLDSGAQTLSFSEVTGDLSVAAIPEPSTGALISLAIAAGLCRRLRRKA